MRGGTALGSTSFPRPLGTQAALGDGWRLLSELSRRCCVCWSSGGEESGVCEAWERWAGVHLPEHQFQHCRCSSCKSSPAQAQEASWVDPEASAAQTTAQWSTGGCTYRISALIGHAPSHEVGETSRTSRGNQGGATFQPAGVVDRPLERQEISEKPYHTRKGFPCTSKNRVPCPKTRNHKPSTAY